MRKNSFLMRQVLRGVKAASEAIYPENDFGAPDWRQTEMVERTYLQFFHLPPMQRKTIGLLFITIEWIAPLFVPALLPFSRLKIEKRARTLQRMLKSKIFLFRIYAEGVKASLQMIYMSHPMVSSYIGEFKGCRYPEDAFPMEIKKNVFRI